MRAGFSIAIIIAVSSCGGAEHPSQSETKSSPLASRDPLKIAKSTHAEGDYPQARKLLTRYLEKHPSGQRAAEARYLLGLGYMKEGKPATALGAYRVILLEHTTSNLVIPTLFDMALAFRELGSCDDALAALNALLQRSPENVPMAIRAKKQAALWRSDQTTCRDESVREFSLIEIKKSLDGGKYDETRRMIRRFLTQTSSRDDAATANFFLGQTYYNEGNHAQALAGYARILTDYPNSPVVDRTLLQMASSFWELRACSDALSALDALLKRSRSAEVRMHAQNLKNDWIRQPQHCQRIAGPAQVRQQAPSRGWRSSIGGVVRIQTPFGTGSGVRIGSRSVVTNYHVVAPSLEQGEQSVALARVTDPGSPVSEIGLGKVVRVAPSVDLALVEVNSLGDIPVLSRGGFSVGDDVFAVGFPRGIHSVTVTKGIASAVLHGESGPRWLQLDAELEVGNSGGAVLNGSGELIGIPSVVISGELSSMRLAIPASLIPDDWFH